MFQEKSVSGLFSCSFCGKSQNEVERIIAGPKDNICSDCAVGFLNQPKMNDVLDSSNAPCGFCGKSEQEAGTLYEREVSRICRGCLGICGEIIGSDLQPAGA